jgi:hypothetical protein
MKTNKRARSTERTHEGGMAVPQNPLQLLRRSVATCMLFENTFYKSGNDIADRIAKLIPMVKAEDVMTIAFDAREKWKLRHVPLWIAVHAAKHHPSIVSDMLFHVIRRPDEMSEFLSLYWKDEKCPLSGQVKKGLARAFRKFSEYQLAKWNRDGKIKLRDVLFLCHAKPKDAEQDALWKRLIDGKLVVPDTWEVELSAGKDKKQTFERLLIQKKLGYMALLMNLRNMSEANVDPMIVNNAIMHGAKNTVALPFRFLTASKHAPKYAQVLSDAMLESIKELKIDGSTGILVDVSGSMSLTISEKSLTDRRDIAAGLAVLIREAAPECRVFTFSNDLVEVPNLRGIGLVNGILNSQQIGGTYLKSSLEKLSAITSPHRMIVITDEQSHDGIYDNWCEKGYLINVAPYKPGLDMSHGWKRINGWSERVFDWMIEDEKFEDELSSVV